MNKVLLYCIFLGILCVCATSKHTTSPLNKNTRVVQSYIRLLKNKTRQLCDLLEQSEYSSQENVKRLLKKRNVSIVQRSNTMHVAYSVNKGEEIGMCINGNNIETMFYVLMHELAHIMTVSKHHTKEFWSNFNFLVDFAKTQGLYHEEKSSATYCGQQIK